jgi:hypothetical protein
MVGYDGLRHALTHAHLDAGPTEHQLTVAVVLSAQLHSNTAGKHNTAQDKSQPHRWQHGIVEYSTAQNREAQGTCHTRHETAQQRSQGTANDVTQHSTAQHRTSQSSTSAGHDGTAQYREAKGTHRIQHTAAQQHSTREGRWMCATQHKTSQGASYET